MVAEVPQSRTDRDKHGPGPFTCIHCKGIYPTWAHLTFHLARCPKRSYPRTFTIGQFQFTVLLNPLKKPVLALRRLAETPKVDGKTFLGGLMAFKEVGLIHSFEVIPLTAVQTAVKSGGSPRPMP